MGPLGTFGPHVGLGVALGDDKRWEIGLHEELLAVVATGYAASSCAFGVCAPASTPFVASTLLGVTGVFFGGRSPAKSTEAMR
jgi:hypothetical protein